MILLIVEGQSDREFFEHVIYRILSNNSIQAGVIDAKGIDDMLRRVLPDAIKLLRQGLYIKVIAIFDWDKMHEPYDKRRTRIEHLQELLQVHPLVGGFPVRENLEDLIENCLDQAQRSEFRQRRHGSKLAAVQWAVKQDLDQAQLKVKLTFLQRSLQCQLMKDFR